MKKSIAVMTSAVALFSCMCGALPYTAHEMTASYAESQTFGDWEYEVTDGAVNIIKYNGDPLATDDFNIVFPSEIDGIKVKSIDIDAFSNKRSSWYYLVIPDDCECIFPQGLLKNREIGGIKQGDFEYFYSASDSGDYLTIGTWTKKAYNEMYDVVVPESVCGYPVKRIQQGVFGGAHNINKLTLPDTIDQLQQYTFSNCSMTEVNIPESVLFIPDRCFSYCLNLKNVIFHDNLLVVSNKAFENTPFEIPEKYRDENATASFNSGRKTVGEWVLNYSYNKSGELVTSLYRYLGSAEVLTIPSEVEGVKITAGNRSNDILFENTTVREVIFDKDAEHITGIRSDYVEKITLPENENITSINFLNGCTALKSLVIPPNIKSIEGFGLNGCSSLEKLVIQSDEFLMKGNAVLTGTKIKELDLPGNCEIAASNFPSTLKIVKFGAGDCVSIYNSAFENSFVENLVFSPDIKELIINQNAFQGAAIEKLELPSGKNTIGSNAFKGCNNLKEIIANGETEISSNAFSDCTALEKVTFNGKSNIGELAFNGCTELSEVNLDLNDNISGRCFNNCPKLYTINGIEVVKDGSAEFAPELKEYIMKNWQTADEVGFIDKFTVNSAKKVVSEVTDDSMTDIQKVKALHDWVCANTVYGNDAEQYLGDHVDSAVFMDGVAVCEGYAKTYNLLLHEAGIKTCCVHNGDHAWNVVKINGEWFHIDTTWDDGDNVKYQWFMRSDADMKNAGGYHATWTLFCPSSLHDFQSAELPACDTEMGDANGDSTIDAKDASAVLAEYSNLSVGNEHTFSDKQTASADINFDGNTDAKDASSILGYYSYLSTGGDKSIMEYCFNN